MVSRNLQVKSCKISKGKGILPKVNIEFDKEKLMVEKVKYLLKTKYDQIKKEKNGA